MCLPSYNYFVAVSNWNIFFGRVNDMIHTSANTHFHYGVCPLICFFLLIWQALVKAWFRGYGEQYGWPERKQLACFAGLGLSASIKNVYASVTLRIRCSGPLNLLRKRSFTHGSVLFVRQHSDFQQKRWVSDINNGRLRLSLLNSVKCIEVLLWTRFIRLSGVK